MDAWNQLARLGLPHQDPVMTATFADFNMQTNEGEAGQAAGVEQYAIPPTIKALFEDLSKIRRVTLVESPQILPLIAPALIEAELHIRQLWASQI